MLSLLATALVFLGLAVSILGSLFFLIAAFRTSILWGLGVFFFAPVSLGYLILHWDTAKKPFYLQLWGVAFILIAALALEADLPFPLG